MPAGSGYRLCLPQKKGNHHENEAEHPTIEKYLRTLMAKKLHGALLVPQKAGSFTPMVRPGGRVHWAYYPEA